MLQRVERIVAELRSAVAELDPDRLQRADAPRIVEVLADGGRLCEAGRALAAQRVLRDRTWRAQGFRTPAQWMAERTQSTLSSAIAAVETAHRLQDLPATREAFVSGRISGVQAAEITAAAATDPSAEVGLLEVAKRETVAGCGSTVVRCARRWPATKMQASGSGAGGTSGIGPILMAQCD